MRSNIEETQVGGASSEVRRTFVVTGAAGFIGMHVCEALLSRGCEVLGIDDMNGYYDIELKQARLARLKREPLFSFVQLDISDRAALEDLVKSVRAQTMLHFAAQAGVRFSITNPDEYTRSNLVGFASVLEAVRRSGIRRLVYASSSSVYGETSRRQPWDEDADTSRPISFYAATKKANEVMAASYSALYGIHSVGLRFFTVYGPWGRPDMAYYLFASSLLKGEPITLFADGEMLRDFTSVRDVTTTILRIVGFDAASSGGGVFANAPQAQIFNVGNQAPERVRTMLAILEELCGRRAHIVASGRPAGDVTSTWASTEALRDAIGFAPNTSLRSGLTEFVHWYREFHSI